MLGVTDHDAPVSTTIGNSRSGQDSWSSLADGWLADSAYGGAAAAYNTTCRLRWLAAVTPQCQSVNLWK
jgi:hypothetical protein